MDIEDTRIDPPYACGGCSGCEYFPCGEDPQKADYCPMRDILEEKEIEEDYRREMEDWKRRAEEKKD